MTWKLSVLVKCSELKNHNRFLQQASDKETESRPKDIHFLFSLHTRFSSKSQIPSLLVHLKCKGS